MAAPSRATQKIPLILGRMLQRTEESKSFSRGSFRFYFSGYGRNAGVLSRMREDAQTEVHPLFRKPKYSYWGLAGVAAAGVYWASYSYKHWKEKKTITKAIAMTYLVIQDDMVRKTGDVLSLRNLKAKREASEYVNHRQQHYWFALQKVKSELEENLQEDMETMKMLKKLHVKVDECRKVDDPDCLHKLLKEDLALYDEYKRRTRASLFALKHAMTHEDGSKIDTISVFRHVLEKELSG